MDGDLKYGVYGKARNVDKRSRSVTVHLSSPRDEPVDRMMVVGRGVPINKVRAGPPGVHIHACHSDTSAYPSGDGEQRVDSFRCEGLHIGLSENPSTSSVSFASATSDVSVPEAIQEKLHELECEMSEKDATILFLRKQLDLIGDKNPEYNSVAVETDFDVTENEDFHSKLNDLNSKIEIRDKTILELSSELEESNRIKGEQVEENQNLKREVSLLNRQLQSVQGLVECDTGMHPNEFVRLRGVVDELEDNLSRQSVTIAELEEALRRKEEDVQQKEKLLEETKQKFLEYKNVNASELTELRNTLASVEKTLADQERLYNDKLQEAKGKMEEDVKVFTEQLEARYREDVKTAMEKCRSSFKKLSGLPKARFDKILQLCETGEFDVVLLQKDWEDQKALLEKKVNALQEEKNKEVNRLTEGYESKVASLKSEIESLNQQLKERKETLDAFEKELTMYRREKAMGKDGREGDCNVNELKHLHAAEILSQQEKHKLEKDLLQNKVKRLSEEILSHANNEKIHLQELQSAKIMASTFREKYERLLAELEDKINSKKTSDRSVMIELDLENSLCQFKCLIHSLKKAEEIHEGKIKFLKKLDQDEALIHHREMSLFRVKLEQVERFKTRLLELDTEIKELIKTVEAKYANTVQRLSSCHHSEVKLKQLELDSMEQQNAMEVQELRKKMKELEDANEALEEEIKANKADFEREVNSLRLQAEELAVELLRNEGMLAVKTEIEDTLTNRIGQLENLIEIKNENSQKELERSLSKCMTAEAMLSAKEEVARELEAKVKENERLLERSNEQVDEVERKCLKLEESFKNLEMMTQIIMDMNNCENYFILKKKMDHLETEFNEMSARSRELEDECGELSAKNAELVHQYRAMEAEKDQILENYRLIEEEMREVVERSRNFESELSRLTAESKLADAKCDEIMKARCGPAPETVTILDKIERIGEQLDKALIQIESEKMEIMRPAGIEAQKKLAEFFQAEISQSRQRELMMREERDDILSRTEVLRESIKAVNDKVDFLLWQLARGSDKETPSQVVETLHSYPLDFEKGDSLPALEDIQPASESPETLKYVMRCESLSRENQSLKRVNDELALELKEMEKEKDSSWERMEMRNSFREEMMSKLESIQREVCDLINEKSGLAEIVESLENDKRRLREELGELRHANNAIQKKFSANLREMSDRSYAALIEESCTKEIKMDGMRKEMKRLVACVKTLNRELEAIRRDNDKLMAESRHHMKSNQSLKEELEEAWSQRREMEDQLDKLRRENAILNLHRDHLEQATLGISNLMSDEDSPSTVSWVKIHEAVENIVDVVQALKTSFTDLSPEAVRGDQAKSKSDYKIAPAALHLELESKTKLCQELILQKTMLEKELECLEKLMKRSESCQTPFEGRGRVRPRKRESQSNPDITSVAVFLPPGGSVDPAEENAEVLGRSEDEPYLETLHKLKRHFEVQVQLQEAQLTEALANEIEGLKKREIQRLEGRGEDETDSEKDDAVDALVRRHRDEIEGLNREHEVELEKLREILKEVSETGSNSLLIHEIETKHGEQMEELRRYFEKKCAELEKNFTEEVFSQQSRKMSNGSEATTTTTTEELPADGDPDPIREEGDDVAERYRRLIDGEESDEFKMKFQTYVREIARAHAEELNLMRTKYDKEMTNLQRRHAQEMSQAREEIGRLREATDAERESLAKRCEERTREMAEERKRIADELEREYERKVEEEVRKLRELLQAESRAKEEESAELEESCMEKLSVYQTESAMKRVETENEVERMVGRRNEERLRRELEEEKVKIAQYYRDLNEAALRRFNEEQENLIRSHSEVMHRLIQEHEERIAELKKAHKEDLERFNCDEETKLAIEFRDKEKEYERELSSLKSTYEGELFELKKYCQDTLNEQVSLAKADAFNVLQKQIQDYLNGDDEDSLASREVIELGEKFAGRYRREIEELKERHHGEVTRIRTEYEDKIRRRYSTGSLPGKRSAVEKMEMKTDDDKLLILRERDALQEMVTSLRHVLSELIRYVGTCEDELNNTIVGEFGKDEETMYRSLHLDASELNETDCSSVLLSKRVHFAPDLSSILSEMNDSRGLNASTQVRMELDRCLRQLKSDASHLLALSNPARKQEENLYEMMLKLEEEKSRIEEKVAGVERVQRELRSDVSMTKAKLAELERTRETVSEGYGEEVVNAQKQENLMKLKEKAKTLMGQHSGQPSDVLHVLDEICKEGDRLQDEARREKNDLQLQGGFSLSGTMMKQVAAADKQLRATRRFLEEQAAERETERDDYTNEIRKLKEALRARERDRSLQDRMSQELELLENQLRDANGRLAEVEKAKADVDTQLKEAVDKIWTLREIIRELEVQVATASEERSALRYKIEELETAREELEKVNGDLMVELENLRTQTRDEYAEHVKGLEEEVSALRRVAERLSPEAVSQMRLNLREIELALSKKTKDLEQLHAASSMSANASCSSPSEDISMCERLDVTGCPTPDEMQTAGESAQSLGLPLEEIDRINEKLMRHTRAEEVAIKTVRDLQLQLKSSRKAMEEIQIERDVLLERADSYLQENSRLKVRLDEQRCNAGLIQRQLSADLESQIKRLELDIEKLNDLCVQKDKQIRDMNIILEQTTKSLKIREAEALNKSNEENEVIVNLKTELRNALDEKRKLEESLGKMKEAVRETVTVPFLVDAMLEEKNAEIDRLEKEVSRLSKQRATSSLIKTQSSTDSANSSKSLKRVKFSEPDSFVQFVSPILPGDQSVARCASDSYAELRISSQKFRKKDQLRFCMSQIDCSKDSPSNWVATPESVSSILPLQLSPRGIDSHLQWSINSNHVPLMSSPKESEQQGQEVESLRRQLSEKSDVIKRYECELSERTAMDAEIDEIRVQLKSTMDAVERDKSMHKEELERLLERESRLQAEVDAKRRDVSEYLLEIDTLKRKMAEVNLDMERSKSEYQRVESELVARDEEIRRLKSKEENLLLTMDTLKRNHLEEVEELQSKLNFEHGRVESVLGELKILEVKKVEIEEEFQSLREDYKEKLTSQQRTVSNLRGEVSELERINRELSEKCDKLEAQMEETLAGADKLSKELADEVDAAKRENDKLRSDYERLKNELDACAVRAQDKTDAGMQTMVHTSEEHCQTSEGWTVTKAEPNEEMSQFQVNVDKLKMEMYAWEQKMNEREFGQEEALSYAALIRTLVSCIVENLDDHFYELQTYRKKMMECSVDDLTDKVQKELMLSAKLDNNLLSKFNPDGLGQSDVRNQSDCQEPTTSFVEDGGNGGDNSLTKKKQNLVNLTVKLYELETNLQEMERKNKDFESQIGALRREKDEEKSRAERLEVLVKLLEDGLAKEKAKLAEEKTRCDEDAKIMEVLRVNFELFVEKVDELERALSVERQQRMTLEKMLKAPGERAEDGSAMTELKCQLEMERQKCASLGLGVEKEKKKCHELRMHLEREKLERMAEKDMQRMLSKDVALLQEQKENLEAQLSFARELLQTRQSEIVALKRKINLQEIDIKALTISNENQTEKEAEMSMMAVKVTELEKELDLYRKQMEQLNDKSENISAPLLVKMKILNNCVQQHVQESNEMGEALLHLTQETEQMRSLIKKMEETAESGAATLSSSDETIVPDMETERKAWITEKERLTSELEKMKSDYEVLKKDSMEVFKGNDSLKLEIKKLRKEVEGLREEAASPEEKPTGIPEDRVLHLFGKYMRADSFRKALAFQKLYLKSVLNGYEGGREEALVRLTHGGSGRSRRGESAARRKMWARSKRKSLRMVALVVVAIKRMQFMVVRWRICRLTAFNSLMGSFDPPTANKENECRRPTPSSLHPGPIDPLRYQTHNFLRQQRGSHTNILRTPPSRDMDSRSRPLDMRKINENIERFNHLHKSFGPFRPP